MAAVLDFRSELFFAIFDRQVNSILPGLSVQEKKFQIHFQDGGSGGHIGFLMGTIKSHRYFLLSFESICISVQEKKFKNRKWQPRRPSWTSDRNDISYF